MPAPIQFSFKWSGGVVSKAVKSGLSKNLRAAGRIVVNEAKEELNVSGGYARVPKSQRKSDRPADRFGSHGTNPSKPGDPPHFRTKNVRRGMFSKLIKNDTVVRVGTTAPEGPLLEFGTRAEKARPFLKSSLRKKQGEVAAALQQPLPL